MQACRCSASTHINNKRGANSQPHTLKTHCTMPKHWLSSSLTQRATNVPEGTVVEQATPYISLRWQSDGTARHHESLETPSRSPAAFQAFIINAIQNADTSVRFLYFARRSGLGGPKIILQRQGYATTGCRAEAEQELRRLVSLLIIAKRHQASTANVPVSRRCYILHVYLRVGRRKSLLLVLSTRKHDEQVRQSTNDRLHRAASLLKLRYISAACSRVVLARPLCLKSQSQCCVSISTAVRWQR